MAIIKPPKSGYIQPWTRIIFHRIPVNPVLLGVCIATLLFVLFFVGRLIFDGGRGSTPGDFRLTIIHILLVAYAASAYVYLLDAVTKTASDMAPVVSHSLQWRAVADRVGSHLWWGLLLAGLLGIGIDIYATNTTTTGSDPWDWQQTNYDSRWMRILGPMFSWWIACLLYVLIIESARLSRLSGSIDNIDLMDLSPYQPLIRQGLTNALLVVGLASVLSLFLFEPGFMTLMIQLTSIFAVVAWIGLILPLRGIRRKIAEAKTRELDWCKAAVKTAIEQLKSGDKSGKSLAELVAYRNLIENTRSWPFDNPTLTRFALYLLIPLGSMLGGALVERGLDLILP